MTSTRPARSVEVEQHLGRVARGGAIGLVGAAVSAGAGFALVVVVTHGYAVAEAGTFFAVTSAFLILTSLATLGVDTGLGRFLLRFEIQGRAGDIHAVLRTALLPALLVSGAGALVVLLLAEELAGVLGLGQDGAVLLRVLAPAVPAVVLAEVCLSGTRAFGRMRTTVFVDRILRAGTQPVTVLVVAMAGAGIVAAAIAWVLPYLAAALLSAVLFRSFLRRRLTGAPPAMTPLPVVRREFWTFTWPRGLTRLAQMAIQRADILIVAALRSPAEAAIYTAATRFVALGQFGTQAIQQVLQPRFTALLAADDRDALRAVYHTATAWSMALSWPMYLLVGAVPVAYLGLFGDEYQQGGTAVVVTMAVAMLLAVATGPVDTLLLMHGRSALSMVNAYVALAVDIVLCFLLIPPLGVWGAALAWAAAVTVRCTMAVVAVRNHLGLVSLSRGALVVAAASLLCFAVPGIALSVTGWATLPALTLAAAVGTVVYAGLLWWARDLLVLGALRSLLRRGTPAAGGVHA